MQASFERASERYIRTSTWKLGMGGAPQEASQRPDRKDGEPHLLGRRRRAGRSSTAAAAASERRVVQGGGGSADGS